MKATYTVGALADLDDILAYTARHFPRQLAPLEQRIRSVVARIEKAPESARRVTGRPDVRVVPLLRYPFKIFYSVQDGQLLILHIHHVARQDP